MTEMTTSAAVDPALRAIQDRLEITDVLYRYAPAIDRFDWDGVRSTLADDLVAQYGNADPVEGGDAVVAWIAEFCADVAWQHHFLSVYHVDADGDHATALVYHTTHQLFGAHPDSPKVLVGRYHNELRRQDGGGKISRLRGELLWAEERAAKGYLEAVGGRGP